MNLITNSRAVLVCSRLQSLTTLAENAKQKAKAGVNVPPSHMSAWQCVNFLKRGTTDVRQELHQTSTRRVPVIGRPDHLLVRVECASLNPIDWLTVQGYGASTFKYARCLGSVSGGLGVPNQGVGMSQFPYTPGRDFAGMVVGCAPSITPKAFSKGQRVVGATWPFLSSMGSGALAEYVVCPAHYLAPIPDNVTAAQAVAVGYAGLTAWSALDVGGVLPHKCTTQSHSLNVLVAGASGGVGIIAAQLAKLWGAHVHVTCPDDAKSLEIMKQLGFDDVIVYPDMPAVTSKYDVIIDCVRPECLSQPDNSLQTALGFAAPRLPAYANWLSVDCRSRYVSLNSPLLMLMDRVGPLPGFGLAFAQLAGTHLLGWTTERISYPGRFRWAFFQPSASRLTQMLSLISTDQLKVYVDGIFPFDQVPEAFDRLQAKGVRCKVIVQVH